MNKNEQKKLIDAVLDESAPADFRAELLDRTLSRVRGRKRAHRRHQVLLAAAVLLGGGVMVLNHRPSGVATNPAPIESALNVINSAPLSPAIVIETVPGSAQAVESSHGTVVVLETKPDARGFRELTDDELLASMAGGTAVLVREGPNQAELLFVDATSRTAQPAGEIDSGKRQ